MTAASIRQHQPAAFGFCGKTMKIETIAVHGGYAR
jgi:hypothetical protein